MATILENRRTILDNQILRLQDQRKLIEEQLRKLAEERDDLQDFVPATQAD